MARPLRIQYPGAFYHVTSRGNERKAIFKSKGDRERFLSYLESANERYDAIIHTYCLMDNHYHILLETPRSNLSQILHHINGAYTSYFNVKRKRFGHRNKGHHVQEVLYLHESSNCRLPAQRDRHPLRYERFCGKSIKPKVQGENIKKQRAKAGRKRDTKSTHSC